MWNAVFLRMPPAALERKKKTKNFPKNLCFAGKSEHSNELKDFITECGEDWRFCERMNNVFPGER